MKIRLGMPGRRLGLMGVWRSSGMPEQVSVISRAVTLCSSNYALYALANINLNMSFMLQNMI